MHPIYFPREDSEILAEQVRNFSKGIVLDVGTGTGIQAMSAAMCKNVDKVYGVDINPAAINFCDKNSKSNHKITYLVSDLFSVFKTKKSLPKRFDTIIFNPPYLPAEHENKDIASIGGKRGYELLERFLDEVNDFLSEEGKIIIVFSSLTNKQKVDEIIAKNLFDKKLLHSTDFFYETLYVYLLKKNDFLHQIDLLGVKNVRYLAQGKRKIVYSGFYKRRKVAVKSVLQGKKSTSIQLEVRFLKILNKHKIGPALLHISDDFLIEEFVDGVFIKTYVESASKSQLKWLFKEVFKQCFVMDCLRINKDEMHHPIKHVLISGKKVVMIDFERCRHTEDPKNVSQFCQYIVNLLPLLRRKGFALNSAEIIFHAKEYKFCICKKHFNNIISLIDNDGHNI